ncbi:hypothetical protein AAZV13_15G185400 [Glycine max]|uniref:SHSP domain-containing protein n=1 Tax=Glycine max TaxID=3847 RepID=A0A0R0G4W9_SOYBN|nr:inactive protein RESTRICTED TEV MOVEMENT 2 [Glycine max]|eukprot:XP_003545726.1 inactive protein RESTRICTED TEV MOVEMENT 2 [Glycine max]
MAFRQREFRPQLSVRRVYETLEPRSETKDLPEAYILRVYIPGFPRENVKITYVASSRTVRITGERPLQGNKWHKMDQSYPIPDYCEPEALQGKFEIPILTLTMPKKITSQVAPKQQEVGTSQEKGEAKPTENVQDTTPPQPTITTSKVEEPIEEKKSVLPPSPDLKAQQKKDSQILSEPIKDQKLKEELVPKPTPPPRVATMQTYEKSQKGQEVVESKPTTTMLTKVKTAERSQKGEEEFESKSKPTMLTKVKTAERAQKGEEEFEAKPTATMLTKVNTAERPQKGEEEFEAKPTPTIITKVKTSERPQKDEEEFEAKSTPTMLTKVKTSEGPQKGEEERESRPAITNVTRKLSVKEQWEENKSKEKSVEDVEKERISKKEVKDEPSELTKPEKDKEEEEDFEEKETKTEKLLAKEAESSVPKVQKKKEKQSSSRSDSKREGKSEENAMEKVGPMSQVFTKIAEGILNEEEKKIVANIGAAVLVITALGYYVSYRFAS